MSLIFPTENKRIQAWYPKDFSSYQVIDSGDGEKLERWGNFVLRRPDGQVIWPRKQSDSIWKAADAVYHRSSKGGGSWDIFNPLLKKPFQISHQSFKYQLELTPFKHTGLFPEQAVNWQWVTEQVGRLKEDNQNVNVLNLFAYTGGATLASAAAGADETVHVDAAKRMVSWARDNLALSGLSGRRVRFIVDDALKFSQREQRRDRVYQGILLDPPVYGRGPEGELWQIEKSLSELLKILVGLLDPQGGFLLLNCYTTGLSAIALVNLLEALFQRKVYIDIGEVALPHENDERLLPAGLCARLSW